MLPTAASVVCSVPVTGCRVTVPEEQTQHARDFTSKYKQGQSIQRLA